VNIVLVSINRSSGNMIEILKNADAACYAAKESSRNRIHIFGEEDKNFSQKHGDMKWVGRIEKALEKE